MTSRTRHSGVKTLILYNYVLKNYFAIIAEIHFFFYLLRSCFLCLARNCRVSMICLICFFKMLQIRNKALIIFKEKKKFICILIRYALMCALINISIILLILAVGDFVNQHNLHYYYNLRKKQWLVVIKIQSYLNI